MNAGSERLPVNLSALIAEILAEHADDWTLHAPAGHTDPDSTAGTESSGEAGDTP